MIGVYAILNRLEQDNLVDWGVILQAWKELPGTECKLSTDYIADYAIAQIEKQEYNIPPNLIELFDAGYDSLLLEKEEVTELLEEICIQEQIEVEISFRKCRLVALEITIDGILHDCIYSLIELTDFWRAWGNPDKKPHTIQGLDSNMSPIEYYAEKNYQELLEAHKIWIEQEKREIAAIKAL